VILIDAGPLVALIDRRDSQHQLCLSTAQQLPRTPLVTTWPCLTEAMHFVSRAAGQRGIASLWRLRSTGQLRLHDLQTAEIDRMVELMKNYQNVPMDLADASLVAAAERLGIRQVSPSTVIFASTGWQTGRCCK
jgi:uncharacterized protein